MAKMLGYHSTEVTVWAADIDTFQLHIQLLSFL